MISKKLRDRRFEIIDRMNREKTKKGKLALRLEFEATIKYKKSCVRKRPMLVSKKAVLTDALGDLKQMLPYRGGRYDKSKFTLVQNGWDHEHCSLSQTLQMHPAPPVPLRVCLLL